MKLKTLPDTNTKTSKTDTAPIHAFKHFAL